MESLRGRTSGMAVPIYCQRTETWKLRFAELPMYLGAEGGLPQLGKP